MKEESLFYFQSPKEFKALLQELDIYNTWQIRHGLLNFRGNEIKDKRYTKYLRSVFKEKGFFRKEVSIAEIVSWLDTSSIMYRLFEELEKRLNDKVYNSIEISLEYMIQMSKKMRVDYLLIYNKTVLLIEFRTVDHFDKIRATWDYKFKELLQYKELMSYYLDDRIFRVYAFVPLYEYNDKVRIQKNYEYNNNQVQYLAEFIERYLIK